MMLTVHIYCDDERDEEDFEEKMSDKDFKKKLAEKIRDFVIDNTDSAEGVEVDVERSWGAD